MITIITKVINVYGAVIVSEPLRVSIRLTSWLGLRYSGDWLFLHTFRSRLTGITATQAVNGVSCCKQDDDQCQSVVSHCSECTDDDV